MKYKKKCHYTYKQTMVPFESVWHERPLASLHSPGIFEQSTLNSFFVS